MPKTRLIRKIIAGGPGRPTRLHTERGEMIPAIELLKLPRAATQFAMIRILRRRPELPWWPLNVIPVIEKHLSKASRVVEFGSGMSTLWLARRAKSVLAIEDNLDWHRAVTDRLNDAAICNATVRHLSSPDYYSVPGLPSDAQFDLAVVDGGYRWKCIEFVLPLMAPGSIIYLDNSDADKDRVFYSNKDDRYLAQKKLADCAEQLPDTLLERRKGLIMGELHAGEGMILRLGR